MLTVQYASQNSPGNLAQAIGWVDYGTELALSNANPTASVVNYIPGGYQISFDLSIKVTGNSEIIPNIIYHGLKTPTFSAAPFGNVDYTGIQGNIALYTSINPPLGFVIDIQIILSNIRVTDISGRNRNSLDFIFFAADTEVTNKGFSSDAVAEFWSVSTGDGVWNRVQLIPSVNGNTTAGPTVSGIGTQTALETGQLTNASTTSANVFSTKNPTQIIAQARVDGGREGFAFGVIVLPDACSGLTPSKVCNIIPVTAGERKCFTPVCYPKSTFIGVMLGSTIYLEQGKEVTFKGNLGSYVLNKNEIILLANQESVSYVYDLLIVMERNICGETEIYPVVFGTPPNIGGCK